MGENMRQLTSEEIEKLASRKGVRRIAVENFLSTMGSDSSAAYGNAEQDTRDYNWNAPTRNAIYAGISLANK
jgi:hypothetical protein